MILRLGEAYRTLWTLDDPWILYESPRGSGKTVAILCRLVSLALEHPGCRIVLVRRYRADLTESVLPTLEEEVFPMFGMTTPPGGWLDRSSRRHYAIGVPGNVKSRIVPIGLDSEQAGSLLSTAWTFAYANEANQIPYKLLLKIDGAMRWIKSPTQPQLPDRPQIFVDLNPVAPMHPLNLRAEECPAHLRTVKTREDYERLLEYNLTPAKDPVHRWKRVVCRIQDNPGYWDMDTWQLTPTGRIYLEERLGGYTGTTKKRWVDGEWAGDEGTVFPEWDETIHVVDDFDPPPDWPQITAWDPGYGTTCISFLTIADDGGIYVFDEIYERGHDVAWYCELLAKKKRDQGLNVLRDFADPNEAFSPRSQGESVAKQALEQGEFAVRLEGWPADKLRAFDAGVELLRTLLLNARRAGNPGFSGNYLKVCKRCKGARENYSSWKYKSGIAPEGEAPEGAEKYEQANDHAIDTHRGAATSRFLQRRWLALREREERQEERG